MEINNNYTDMDSLTPFKLCVLQNFPFIEADFDALTNYQLLCKVVEYLNNIIDNNNKQNDNITQLEQNFITLYNYVKDYFDNLDVQEEINNKLDEMVQDGTFGLYLSNYIPYVTPEMFGAKGDGINDDTSAIINALNNLNSGGTLLLSKEYYITSTLNITKPQIKIIGLGRTEFLPAIKTDKDITMLNISNYGIGLYDFVIDGGDSDYLKSTLININCDELSNGNIDCLISNLTLINAKNGIIVQGKNMKVYDCLIGCRNSITLNTSEQPECNRGFEIVNNRFHVAHICITNNINTNQTPKNILIKNNFIDYTGTLFSGYGGGLDIIGNYHSAINFETQSSSIVITSDTVNSVNEPNIIDNNTIIGSDVTTNGIFLNDNVNCIIKNNNISNCKGTGIQATGTSLIVLLNNTVYNSGESSGNYPIVTTENVKGVAGNNTIINCSKNPIYGTSLTTYNNNIINS